MREHELLQMLEASFKAISNSEREKASVLLAKKGQEDPEGLTIAALNIISDRQIQTSSRNLVFTYLSKILLPSEEEGRRCNMWRSLSQSVKRNIKGNLLTLLVSDDADIKRSACTMTANVFVVDCLTDREWLDLLPILTSSLSNSNMIIKRAAVTTLGYICDTLFRYRVTNISDEQIEPLLMGICKGLEGVDELTETAIQAFSSSIQFLQRRLNDPVIAKYIVELLLKLLCSLNQIAQGSEMQRNLIFCITKISKMLFKVMTTYLPVLYAEMLKAYQHGPGMVVACNQFFIAMVKMEDLRGTRYLSEIWRTLMDNSLHELLKLKPDEDDEEIIGGSILTSILDLMTSLNKIYFQFTFAVLRDFITTRIDVPSESERMAAMIAFESLIESSVTDELEAFVGSGFMGVLSFLEHGSIMIRKNTSRFLLKIVRNMPELFFIESNFLRGSKILIDIMNTDDHSSAIKTIQVNSALIFSELTKSALLKDSYLRLMRSITESLFSSICKLSLVSNDIFIIDNYFSIIFDFVQRVIDHNQYASYLNDLNHFMKQVQNSPSPHKVQLYEFIFINMTVIITQMGRSDKRYFTPENQHLLDLTRDLFMSVILIFNVEKTMISEGLLLMTSILIVDPEENQEGIKRFLEEFVKVALKDYQNTDIFKLAVESVGLCVKRYEAKIEPYVGQVYSYFIELLKNDVIQKDMKITIFFALSDFILHIPSQGKQNIVETIKLAELALQAVVHFQESGQEDLIDFADVFKETLIDFYLCMIHGIYLKDSDCESPIEASMQRVFEFVDITTRDSQNPSINYLTNCISLLIDFYSKKKSINLIRFNVIETLYNRLKMLKNHGDINSTLEYVKKYFSTIDSDN